MADKKRFLDKDYTRRQFLKLSGKSLAGLALSTSMLSAMGVTEKAVAEDKVRVWAFPQGLLVVDADRCVGCQRCEINCTLTNDGCCSSYISRVKVTRNLYSSRNGNGLYTENNWTYFPDTCRQCEDPACGNAARCRRFYADESGIRRVDPDQVRRLRCLPRGLPVAYADRQPRHQEILQVHHVRRLRRGLPVRCAVHHPVG